MDTSGSAWWSILADLVLLGLFVLVAGRLLPGSRRRRPVLAVAAVVVIGIPSLLQFVVPGVGRALQRDPAATLHGQWWRPLTALLAQDGGLVAAVFNLVVVALVVGVAERIWGRGRTLAAFLGAGLVVNLIALGWSGRGGGSSFAIDGLVLALTIRTALERSDRVVRIVAGVMTAIGLALVVGADAHGLAMLVGAAIGTVIAAVESLRARRPTEEDGPLDAGEVS